MEDERSSDNELFLVMPELKFPGQSKIHPLSVSRLLGPLSKIDEFF